MSAHPLRRRQRLAPMAAAALTALLGVAGCDMRVVELVPLRDAAPPTPDAAAMPTGECKTFTRDDGVVCRICFGPDGMASGVICPPPPPIGPVTPPMAPGAASCRVTVEGTDRCAVCPSAMGNELQMTCLACEPAAASSGGGQCRVCVWSDDPTLRCLQCFDATGALREDSCDGLRRETLVYPSGTADAGVNR
jgi:hypothetical protein